MDSIEWQTSTRNAFDSAQIKNKPILLDFYNPKSIGCQQMNTVTYPAKEVVKFVNNYLIPLRINVKDQATHEDYIHFWTPAIAVLNSEGNQLQQTIGFLGVDDFITSMLLGIAKVHIEAGEYDMAMIPLKSLQETFPKSRDVPEAIYFCGVTLFKESKEPGKLKEAYEKLLTNYPNSAWTDRASPFRLL